MSLHFAREYKNKLVFADKAAKIVNSGDWIKFAFEACIANEFDHALAMRRDELQDIKVLCELRDSYYNILESSSEHFCRKEDSALPRDKRAFDIIGSSPALSIEGLPAYSSRLIFVASVSPMNKEGYFSFGVQRPGDQEALETADYVMVEVNENIPGADGRTRDGIHISQVDFVIIGGNSPLLPELIECRIENEQYTGKHKKNNPGAFVNVRAV